MLTRLQCQNCSAVLERKDEYQHSIRCKYCGSSYEIDPSATAGNSGQLIQRTGLRPVRPDNLDIQKSRGKLSVSRKWRSRDSFIMLIFSLVWLGATLNLLVEVWLEGADASILFLLVFVGVGGMLLYRALSRIFNTSTLSVDKQTIRLDTGPFPWKGDFSHPMMQIKYFEIVPPPGHSIANQAKSSRICAVTDDDRRLTLVEKLGNPGNAIYLLRELNRFVNQQ